MEVKQRDITSIYTDKSETCSNECSWKLICLFVIKIKLVTFLDYYLYHFSHIFSIILGRLGELYIYIFFFFYTIFISHFILKKRIIRFLDGSSSAY